MSIPTKTNVNAVMIKEKIPVGRWCDAAEPRPRFVPPVLVAVAFVDGADAVPLVLPVAVAVLEAVLTPSDAVELDDMVVEF